VVVSKEASWDPAVKNVNQFLEEGGLFILNQAQNSEKILKQVYYKGREYSVEALNGLFLRDLKGVPAWVVVLKNQELKEFTTVLLTQFIQKNPKTYAQTLEKSMELLTNQQKQECMSQILAIKASNDSLLGSSFRTLTTVFSTLLNNRGTALNAFNFPSSSDSALYEKQLQTWHKPSKETPNLLAYCQRCMQKDGVKKHLIELSASTHVDSLRFALERYAKKTKRPVFYVNSPRDLVCSAPFIQRDKDKANLGVLQKGPGGPPKDLRHVERSETSP
jgi:hypothetical protein